MMLLDLAGTVALLLWGVRMRLAGVLEAMLGGLRAAIQNGERKRLAETKRMNDNSRSAQRRG